jgi:mono/diheme cytochrome c family protein
MGGGMMMFMGKLACASCHGPDARGGIHRMHMHIMNSPDIRWKVLSGEEHSEGEAHEGDASHEHAHSHEGYSLDAFRMAVTEGKHPDGDLLSDEMPRWQIGNDDLKDLAEFLKSLP